MGMYTEVVVKISLKEETPKEVDSVLEYLFGDGEEPKQLPDHMFFTLPRWYGIGQCSSYYHHPEVVSSIVYDKFTKGRKDRIDQVFSRSDLKDYNGEIDNFFDWIRPYIEGKEGQCIGYSWYEEDSQPTLIYK